MSPGRLLGSGETVSTLYDFMKRVPDPRSGRRIKHGCAEVLTCLVLGYCAGRTTLKRAMEWCARRIEILRKSMPLPNGVASASTACRLLMGIGAMDLADVFMRWAAHLATSRGACLVLDGKGIRASARKMLGERTPYVMNMVDAATGLCVGVLPVGQKENEKPAVHRLLDLIDIKGSLILADAMATDAKIMGHIRDMDANFLLQVKKNNPETYAQLMSQMETLASERKLLETTGKYNTAYQEALGSYSEFKSQERNRERHEYRICQTTKAAGLLERSQTDLPFLKTVGRVMQVRIPIERDSNGDNVTPSLREFLEKGSGKRPEPTTGDGIDDDISVVGIISDADFDSETALAAKRTYWAIENRFHYVLDHILDEDRSTARKGRVSHAILRRFAYNILRIVQLREGMRGDEMGLVSDAMCDNTKLAEKYIFGEIANFI